MVSEMQVSILQVCIIIDGSARFMSPSQQAILLYTFWDL